MQSPYSEADFELYQAYDSFPTVIKRKYLVYKHEINELLMTNY